MAALVGKRAVTRAMAERNRRRHVTPMRERPPVPGLVGLDAAGVWAAIARREFPPPVRGPWGLAWALVSLRHWTRK